MKGGMLFQGGASFVHLSCYLCFVSVMLGMSWALELALLYVMFSCVLSLSHVVSWVRCVVLDCIDS